MHRVKLIYFKDSGKYYSEGEYDSQKGDLHEIWDEVREMRDGGRLPGLMSGHSKFVVSIDVPGHPQAHPHLIP